MRRRDGKIGKNRENICLQCEWNEIGVSFLCYRRTNPFGQGKTIFFFVGKITKGDFAVRVVGGVVFVFDFFFGL